MATAEDYAAWIVANPDKRGTPEFETVAKAYTAARGQQTPPLMAAMGNLAGGAFRGAGSIGATLLAPLDMAKDAMAGKGLSLESNRQRRADMDAALNNLGFDTQSGWFQGGKLLSEVGGTMGVGGALARGAQALGAAPSVVSALNTAGFSTGNVPTTLAGRAGDMALRSAAGAVTGGASAGLVNPEQADVGAITGGALPGGVKLAGMVGSKVGGMFRPTPANASLADKAINQYGIPLSVADVSNSALVKGTRSALDDVPVIGNIGKRQREAVQGAFNREIGKTFGENADSLTPQVLDSAKKRMGAEFDRIWNRNALQFDGTLFQQIQQLRNNAAKLPQGEQARLSSWLDDFENKLAADPQGNLYMAGDVANRFQSTLRREAEKAASFLKDDLSNLRKSVIDAFNRSVSPSDAAALTKNRGQYKAFKTVEDLLQGAEAGVAGRSAGDVPAALLPQAVRKSYGANISNSPFADLSQIGSQYVADRVARTGGSARAMFQNSALGSGLALGAWTNPMVPALAIPSAFGLEGLLSSPAVARRLLNPSTSGLLMSPDLYRPIPVIAADQ